MHDLREGFIISFPSEAEQEQLTTNDQSLLRFRYSRPASVSNCVKIVVDGVDSRVPKSPSAGGYLLSTGTVLPCSSLAEDSGREPRADSGRSRVEAEGSTGDGGVEEALAMEASSRRSEERDGG